MHNVPRFLLAALALASLQAFAAPMASRAASQTGDEERVLAAMSRTDRLIVKYRNLALEDSARGVMARQVASNRQGVRFENVRRTAQGARVLRANRVLEQRELLALAQSLQASDPNIEYVEPDLLMQPQFVPNDTQYAQQWHLSDATGGIRAPSAWDRARGTGVVVAVIDTGVRPHADLKANLLPGYDFIIDTKIAGDGNGRDADAADVGDFTTAGQCAAGQAAKNSSWHGTHVAGIVAASGNNGIGVAGVAFGARIVPVRALGRCGGYTSDIADAIIWS
ncbi:MAG: S8 family serine peptidase, partial [Inhella sp.]